MIDRSKFGLFFPCPHCGEDVAKTIGQLEGKPHTICPSCDGLIDLTNKEWQARFREMVRDLDEIFGKTQ